MDKLEWIDVILVALVPGLGVVLYLVYRVRGEYDRAEASIWALIIAFLMYYPLVYLLGRFAVLVGFPLLLCIYYLGRRQAQQRLGNEYEVVRPTTDMASESPLEGTARSVEIADIPSSCPNCGAALTPEEVERTWDGTVSCPYCEHTVEVP
jgi:hypothetical protein